MLKGETSSIPSLAINQIGFAQGKEEKIEEKVRLTYPFEFYILLNTRV